MYGEEDHNTAHLMQAACSETRVPQVGNKQKENKKANRSRNIEEDIDLDVIAKG